MQQQEQHHLLSRAIERDQQWPDPWELMRPVDPQHPVANDYRMDGLQSLIKVDQHYPLPAAIIAEQSKSWIPLFFIEPSSRCFMGLLPVLKRAWMSIDNELFVWEVAGRDLCRLELAQNQIILDVHSLSADLFPGVFASHIRNLLLVITASEIQLVAIETEESFTLTLRPTGLATATEGVNMISMTVLKQRIFLAGQDGELYEVRLEPSGWLQGRRLVLLCQSASFITHLLLPSILKPRQLPLVHLSGDAERGWLWSLSENGQVNLYGLLERNGISHLASLRLNLSVPAIAIHAAPPSLSLHYQACVTDLQGHRHYLSLLTSDQLSMDRRQLSQLQQHSSHNLRLILTRTSPEDPHSVRRDARRLLHRWSPSVHQALSVPHGWHLLASAVGEGKDALYVVGVNQARLFSPAEPFELASDFDLEGRVWDMQSIEVESETNATSSAWHSLIQASSLPDQVWIMTNAGVYQMSLLGPLQRLQLAMKTGQGEVVKGMLKGYGRVEMQVMAMSLMIGGADALQLLTELERESTVPVVETKTVTFFDTAPQATVSTNLNPSIVLLARIVGSQRWSRPIKDLSPSCLASPSLATSLHRLVQLLRQHPLACHANSELINLAISIQELCAFLTLCLDYRLIDSHFQHSLATLLLHIGLVRELATSLVQHQLKLGVPIESLCAILRQRAPSLFGPEEVWVWEGMEHLQRALADPYGKDQAVDMALIALLRATGTLSSTPSRLDPLLTCMSQLAAYPAMVRLTVACGRSVDPEQRQASAYWLGQEESKEGGIHTIYGRLLELMLPLIGEGGELNAAVPADKLRSITLACIAQSGDDLLIWMTTEWLIKHGLGSLCLEMDCEAVERLLERRLHQQQSQHQSDTMVYGDLLWKRWAAQGRTSQAAALLHRLALDGNIRMDLADRVEHLSRALAILKGSSSVDQSGLRTDLEDRLAVASVQLWMLREAERSHGADLVTSLQERLYTVSEVLRLAC